MREGHGEDMGVYLNSKKSGVAFKTMTQSVYFVKFADMVQRKH